MKKIFLFFAAVCTFVACDPAQEDISNGTSIEITEGLAEGDTIYIASRVSSEEEISAQKEAAETDSQGQSDMQDMFGGQMPDMESFMQGGQMPGNMPGGQMPDMGNMPGAGQRPGRNNI